MHFYLISSQNFWTFEVPHVEKGCVPFKPPISGGNVTSTCVFYFSLCHPVPSLCTENCGICLTNKVSFWGHDYDNKTLYTMPKKTGGFDPNKKVNFDSGKFEFYYFYLTPLPVEIVFFDRHCSYFFVSNFIFYIFLVIIFYLFIYLSIFYFLNFFYFLIFSF